MHTSAMSGFSQRNIWQKRKKLNPVDNLGVDSFKIHDHLLYICKRARINKRDRLLRVSTSIIFIFIFINNNLEVFHNWCCSRYNRCLHIICNDLVTRDTVTKTVCVWICIGTERKAINRDQTHSAISPSILYVGRNIIPNLIPTSLFTCKELLHDIAIIDKFALDILTHHFIGLSSTNRFARFSLFSFQNHSVWI